MLNFKKIISIAICVTFLLPESVTAEFSYVLRSLKDEADQSAVISSKERSAAAIRACRGIRNADTTKKIVALTFDDGPNNGYTREILEILRENNIHGTFFMVGQNVTEYPKVVQEAFLDGNIIANHTESHHNLANLEGEAIEQELVQGSQAIHKVIGKKPLLFRPPYGSCSIKSFRVARNLGLKTIMWSSITDDYHFKATSPTKIASEIISLVGPGAIITLHDGGGNRQKTVEALAIIIKELKGKGYEFVTIPELLGIAAYAEDRESSQDTQNNSQ